MTIVQAMKYLVGGWYSALKYSLEFRNEGNLWIWRYIWGNFWRYGVKRDYISMKHKKECSNPSIERDYRGGKLDAEIYPYLVKLNNDNEINTHFSCWGHNGKDGSLQMTISWRKLKKLKRGRAKFLATPLIIDLEIRDFGIGIAFEGDGKAPKSLAYITEYLLSL